MTEAQDLSMERSSGAISPASCIRNPATRDPQPASALQRATRRAFTLIELLVSMTVLIIMVLIVVSIMADSTRAVNLGYEQTYDDNNLRAVFDTLVDDMMQSVCSADMPMRLWTTPGGGAESQTYDSVFKCHKIRFFAALGPLNACHETVQEVDWEVDADDQGGDFYRLTRGMSCGNAGAAAVDSYPLIEHVVEFKIKLMEDWWNPGTGAWELREMGGGSNPVVADALPMLADVYIATISDMNHKRAMSIADLNTRRDYIRRNAKRHFFQVIFPAREARFGDYNYPEQES